MTTQRDLDPRPRRLFDGRSVSRAPDGLLDAALAGIEKPGSGRACSSPTGGGRGGW